jgi:hypothetical protein
VQQQRCVRAQHLHARAIQAPEITKVVPNGSGKHLHAHFMACDTSCLQACKRSTLRAMVDILPPPCGQCERGSATRTPLSFYTGRSPQVRPECCLTDHVRCRLAWRADARLGYTRAPTPVAEHQIVLVEVPKVRTTRLLEMKRSPGWMDVRAPHRARHGKAAAVRARLQGPSFHCQRVFPNPNSHASRWMSASSSFVAI